MSAEAQIADEVVKVTIDGMTYLIKGTAETVAFIGNLVSEDNKSENTAGKVKMKEMIKEGGDIKLYEIPAGKLKSVVKEAKPFAIKYAVCSKKPNKLGPNEKVIVAVPLSQAPLFERVAEKCRVFELENEPVVEMDEPEEDIENTSDGDNRENEKDNPAEETISEEKEEQEQKEEVDFTEHKGPEAKGTGKKESRSLNNSNDSQETPNLKKEEKSLQEETMSKTQAETKTIKKEPELTHEEKMERISKNMEIGYYNKRFRPSVMREQLVYASDAAEKVNQAREKVREAVKDIRSK